MKDIKRRSLTGEAGVEEITMEPNLHIRLFGDFSLIYADQQVTNLNNARLQSLLAYLVLHRDAPQQRQHLAFLFWPDAAEAHILPGSRLPVLSLNSSS